MTELEEWYYREKFSNDEVTEIFGIFDNYSPSQELIERLQFAAKEYVAESWVYMKTWPKRKQQRSALKSVQKAAVTLKKALQNYQLIPVENIEVLENLISVQHLDKFEIECEKICASIPRTGAERNFARYNLVQNLGRIYYDITVKRPTFGTNSEGKPDSQFFRFVVLVLATIGSHEKNGAETDIRKFIKNMKKFDY